MKIRKIKLRELAAAVANVVSKFVFTSNEELESLDKVVVSRKKIIDTGDHYCDALKVKFDEIVDAIKEKLERGYQQTEEERKEITLINS